MNNYIDTIYDKKLKPFTAYPNQLCKYLMQRFEIRKGCSLLDVGCGRGDFANSFKDLGLNVSGLDRDKSRHPCLQGVEVQYADIEKEPFPYEDQIFDVIFSKSVIEHLSDPKNFIMECYRVLKPKGKIIIMTPDWISQMKVFYDDYTHKQPYTVAGVNNILKVYGFQDVTAERFYQLPIIWKYPVFKVISSIIRYVTPVGIARKSCIKYMRWSTELMILAKGVKAV